MTGTLRTRVTRLEGRRQAEPFAYLDDSEARLVLDAAGQPGRATGARPRSALDSLVRRDRAARQRLIEALTLLQAAAPEVSPC